MRFGMKFVDSCIVELIDMETAEILAEGPHDVQAWLTAYDGNYTLTLVQGCFLFDFWRPACGCGGSNFLLYHSPNNLSRDFDQKNFFYFFPKSVDKQPTICYTIITERERKGQPQREVAIKPSKTQTNDPYRKVATRLRYINVNQSPCQVQNRSGELPVVNNPSKIF